MSKVAQSDMGMVVAAHPLAAEAGRAILALGGNAADAAVAAAYVIAVVEPTMNGIGGRNQILLRTPDGSYIGYGGMTEVPASYVMPESPDASGFGVVGIPGAVSSLNKVHQEYGILSLDLVMAAAIRIARDGFALLPGEAARHAIGREAIESDPGLRRTFLKSNGETYAAGEILTQRPLARTLNAIAESNGSAFYKGPIAETISHNILAAGGFVSESDLAGYQAAQGRYVSTSYRGFEVHSLAAPAGGGLLIKTLNLLEQLSLPEMHDASWAVVMNQALSIAINGMREDYYEPDLEKIQSKPWAKQRATDIVTIAANLEFPASNSKQLNLAQHDWAGESWGDNSHHTTHLVTADCSGMTVSMTQTLGPLFGAKVSDPELGIVYAATMGTYLSAADQSPGSRPRTTIAPTVVSKDGEVVLVLGAAGGLRILSAITQVISRYIDQGMSLEQALAAPRLHPMRDTDSEQRNFNPRGINLEAGWSAAVIAAINSAAFETEVTDRVGAFGRVHALEQIPAGWSGIADPDWEGISAGQQNGVCTL
jgi:gamma-glutamyltranspeptidase/glutathione hydrolase